MLDRIDWGILQSDVEDIRQVITGKRQWHPFDEMSLRRIENQLRRFQDEYAKYAKLMESLEYVAQMLIVHMNLDVKQKEDYDDQA